VVAGQLLPLLEENPGNWEAIGFLNLEVPDDASFRDYLQLWYQRAPLQHRQFVRRTMSLFGLPAPEGQTAVAASQSKESAATNAAAATAAAPPGAAGPASEQQAR